MCVCVCKVSSKCMQLAVQYSPIDRQYNKNL